MSIEGYREKIKSVVGAVRDKFSGEAAVERYFTITIIILVGIGSFGLGRLSVIESAKNSVVVENSLLKVDGNSVSTDEEVSRRSSQTASAISSVNSGKISVNQTEAGGKFVASRNGAKYYFPWCAGAIKIAEQNKIWFNSETEARAKGYTPAVNCKGLR